jgi:hypothetical protein
MPLPTPVAIPRALRAGEGSHDRIRSIAVAVEEHPEPDVSSSLPVACRKKLYDTPDALQADLDQWMAIYNEQRTHQSRWCFGKTPMRTFLHTAAWAREKQNAANPA